MSHIDNLRSVKKEIINGNIPIRGTNLGGWLVAEHWLTKSSPAWNGVPDNIADGGEFVTMMHLGHEKGNAQFKAHRDSFYTEKDFAEISSHGLNVVRIPVGYWIVGFDNSGGEDPDGWKVYAPGGLEYLDQAIREWAPSNNILIIVDIHAAKGSQNGMDHSSPQNPNHSYWARYPENVKNTLDAVEFLARRYKDDIAMLGIGLLNEPLHQDINVLKQYYYDSYERIRHDVGSDMLITICPLLNQQNPGVGDWDTFMNFPDYVNLRHEWHPYFVWGYEGRSSEEIIYAAENYRNQVSSWRGNWLFIGEFSLASAASMSDDQMRHYFQVQMDSFSATKGWAFWAWKHYGDNKSEKKRWSMKSMYHYGFLSDF